MTGPVTPAPPPGWGVRTEPELFRRREFFAVGGATAGAAVVGLLVSGVATGRILLGAGLLGQLGGAARLAFWLVALAVVASVPRPRSSWARLGLAVGAAAVVDLGFLLVGRVPPEETLALAGPLTFLLTASAAIGGSLATGLLSRAARRGTAGRGRAAPVASAVLLVVGSGLIGTMFLQYMSIYFTFDNSRPPPTAAEIARYERTAVLCLATLVAAVVVAAARRTNGLVIVGLMLCAIALGTAFLFSVPAQRWQVDPRDRRYELPDDYVPCFGEGDPGCKGE